MKVIRRRIRLLAALFVGLFGLTGAYFCYSAYFYGGRWVANPHNPRISAQKKAVVYCVRGAGRSAARGLSFCYAADLDQDELDIYAKNCPSPHYLAYLDAISPWTASFRKW